MNPTVLAAVDLGSNSFHLQIARVTDGHLYPLDALKETVRLGAGVTADKSIDPQTGARALAVLKNFGERLRDLPPEAVRVVGTNALRVAKNAKAFVAQAEAALGFPIEIIAGREEARLIYLGVVQSLPPSQRQRLVVDIGGGSTEFIVGHRLKPKVLESLYMGCVSYSERHFPAGGMDKKRFREAQLAARREIEQMAKRFLDEGWDEAIGSSGSAKALSQILEANAVSNGDITLEGLQWLREKALKAGGFRDLALPGVKGDRVPVLPGGLAIMVTIFEELKLERMAVADTALRDGVLHDLLGRTQQVDIRDSSVTAMMKRYHVELPQADRVARVALALFDQGVGHDAAAAHAEAGMDLRQQLDWAARLHETGAAIAQANFHKHSAYIIGNADLPGFSKREQAALATLVLSQRGKLAKVAEDLRRNPALALPVLCLRLAVLLSRSRRSVAPQLFTLAVVNGVWRLSADAAWLALHSLTAYELGEEAKEWKSVGMPFEVLGLDTP
ncbi:MAG: exopolyphosphatase [Betaproteobacteria bacterium]|nr:exopolyphosphatase [Betaproteobacteria bacterium]